MFKRATTPAVEKRLYLRQTRTFSQAGGRRTATREQGRIGWEPALFDACRANCGAGAGVLSRAVPTVHSAGSYVRTRAVAVSLASTLRPDPGNFVASALMRAPVNTDKLEHERRKMHSYGWDHAVRLIYFAQTPGLSSLNC